ncbi:MAG: hypothetical protein GAK45_00491 [Pseudomonas citronellolis]|nr:MAG: hypothetical protein GAK45_00491 [Pseudomonas citronellolis]
MPWDTRVAMSLKEEFIALALHPDSNRRDLCLRFNISSQTAYKWLRRYHVSIMSPAHTRRLAK